MLQYKSAEKAIQTGKIGIPKMIRTYRLEKLQNLPLKEALFVALYTDVKFIMGQLSSIKQVYAKTHSYSNTIISIKHDNHTISHIAVNYTKENCPSLFKVEVVGSEGIVDYDSDKSFTVYGSKMFDCDYSVNYDEYKTFMKEDNDETVLEVLSMIERSLTNNEPVRRGV